MIKVEDDRERCELCGGGGVSQCNAGGRCIITT